jgi:hypothetical protein
VYILGSLVVEGEDLQIERVIAQICHRETMSISCAAKDFRLQQPLGITIDLVSLSWQIFNGSALASLDLSIWIYLPSDGEIQAVSRNHKIRTLVEIPEISASMRIEAKFSVEDIEASFGEAGDEIAIEALILLEGLVLEKRILHVVTGVRMESDTGLVEQQKRATSAQSRFLSVIGNLPRQIINILRRSR